MKNNSKLKYLFILLYAIILLILCTFVVLWFFATMLLYPVFVFIILKLSESGTLCLDLIPSWYQQITIITMGGVLLFAFLPMEILRAIKHKSEKNDVFIERNDKNGGYE